MKRRHLLLKTSVIIFVLLVMAFVVYIHLHGDWRNLFVRDFYFKRNLERINLAVLLYAEKHNGIMPTASSWADLIKDKNPLILKEDFVTPMSYSNFGIYYNNALENKSLPSLKENTVVLFTAKGKWNSNGNIQYFREHSSHRHVYVITINGEIYRYNPDNDTYLRLKNSQEINSGSLYWE